ncbi:MAG: hypothetical protein MUC97_02700 [Bernardetiaceae bacterium]|nr:hypothetical protein [Bernardetiaceae bacterium]
MVYLVYGTLILLTVAYGAVLGVSLWQMVRAWQAGPGIKKPQPPPAKLGTTPAAEEPPRLQPLNCPQCGGGLALAQTAMRCTSCGTDQPVPAAYGQLFTTRRQLLVELQAAERFWHQAQFWVLRPVQWGLWAAWAWLWLWAGLALTADAWQTAEQQAQEATFARWLGDHPVVTEALTWGGGLAFLVWLFALPLAAGLWQPQLRKALPTTDQPSQPLPAEATNCPQCGGGIEYAPEALATLCGYCGTETFRAKLVWQAQNQVNQARQAARFSLRTAMAAYREKWADLRFNLYFLTWLFTLGFLGVGLLTWLSGD